MGIYDERVLPRIQNRIMDNKAMRERRRRVWAELDGEVVELGFGSGLNVPHYPGSVTGVSAVDPSSRGFELAEHRLAESTTPVHRAGLDGARLDLDDGAFDTALSTWTLCTIPDVATALREVRRVLKPGGTLHFVEHGLAPDASVRRWQHRLEPVQKRVFGGCHLTRRIVPLLEDAGFEITDVDMFYEDGAPKFVGADSLGTARSA